MCLISYRQCLACRTLKLHSCCARNVGDRQGEFLASVDSYYPLEDDAAEADIGMMAMTYDDDDYDNDYDEDRG